MPTMTGCNMATSFLRGAGWYCTTFVSVGSTGNCCVERLACCAAKEMVDPSEMRW
jgi:hypothetical protein